MPKHRYTPIKIKGVTEHQRQLFESLNASKRLAIGTIEHLLANVNVPRQAFIDLLRRAEPTHASVKFLDCWDSLHEVERNEVDLDSFAKVIGVRNSEIIGSFVEELCRYRQTIASLRAALALDNVVQTSLTVAQTPEGIEDRKIILKNQKFIAETKPNVTNVNVGNTQIALGEGVRSFEALLKGQLSEGEIIEGELVDNEPKLLTEGED